MSGVKVIHYADPHIRPPRADYWEATEERVVDVARKAGVVARIEETVDGAVTVAIRYPGNDDFTRVFSWCLRAIGADHHDEWNGERLLEATPDG